LWAVLLSQVVRWNADAPYMLPRGATPLSVASVITMTMFIVTLQYALANWSQLGIGHLYFAPILFAAILIGPRSALLLALAALAANVGWYAVTPDTPTVGTEAVALLIRGSAYVGVAAASGYYAAREHRLRTQLSKMAMTDALTGLYNRHAFRAELDRSVESGRPFALLAADVDSLKWVNDSQGHTAGDTRIIELARALRLTCGADAPIARVGGDEFLAIVPGGDLVPEDLEPIRVFAAVGIARYPSEARTGTELVELADRNLYLNKRSRTPKPLQLLRAS
jgi:GGDEF domain-containing protein